MTKIAELNRRKWGVEGLPKGEFKALCAIDDLSQEKGDGLTVSRLSKKMQVTAPAMSQLLNSLEKKRLVKREQSPKDRRVVYVSITEQGSLVLEETRPGFEREASAVLARLGEEDAARLAEILEKLYRIVKELEAEGSLPAESSSRAKQGGDG